MRRVTDPLALMGARFTFRGRDGLPSRCAVNRHRHPV
jgi:hypothetical protein